MSKGDPVSWQQAGELAAGVVSLIGEQRAIVAGSLRRLSPTVRDIDIVCIGEWDIYKSSLVEDADVLVSGPEKTRFVIDGMQVDVVCVEQGTVGAALLYLTGPKEFNIKLRSYAKSRGYKLNEHGLFKDSINLLIARSEREIFKELGLHFIDPEDRTADVDLEGCESESFIEVCSDRNPSKKYRVTKTKDHDLACSCPGFTHRGYCKHVRRLVEQMADGTGEVQWQKEST